MAKNCGKLVLLYIEDASTPGTYNLIGGMQANTFTVNKETVDVTDKGASGNRTLHDCGIRSCSIAGNGVFEVGDASLLRLLTSILGVSAAGAIYNFRIAFGSAATPERITGAFQITSMERTGEYNGAETFSVSLESSGTMTYSVAVP